MDSKEFDAILAKNIIARQLRDYREEGINIDLVMSCLNDIEQSIGTANQPNVEDIFNSKQNI